MSLVIMRYRVELLANNIPGAQVNDDGGGPYVWLSDVGGDTEMLFLVETPAGWVWQYQDGHGGAERSNIYWYEPIHSVKLWLASVRRKPFGTVTS